MTLLEFFWGADSRFVDSSGRVFPYIYIYIQGHELMALEREREREIYIYIYEIYIYISRVDSPVLLRCYKKTIIKSKH